jgi:hypothetical protein
LDVLETASQNLDLPVSQSERRHVHQLRMLSHPLTKGFQDLPKVSGEEIQAVGDVCGENIFP